ncbi:MAG TPA: universal stress protein, partial [Fodinibius sp.]|nr:universal stress protein [Fodinibius sp.]
MESIKKVLVPTDFSENASSAYEHALEIARRFNATVDFIHIIPTLKYFSESIAQMGGTLDMEGEIYPKAQKNSIQKMEKLMEECLPEEYRGEAICKIGRKPSARIVDWARDGGYDLIVVASKGKHETHLLRGSITEKLIRHSEVPIFSVDKKLSSDGLNRILLPTDGSQLSFLALPMALSLAEIYGTEIIFYHALELYGEEIRGGDAGENPQDDNIYETIVDRLEAYLDTGPQDHISVSHEQESKSGRFEIDEEGGACSVPFTIVIEKSVSAHLGIESYAETNADIVVMATHGRSGWARLFLGSTTEKVSKHLAIPV